MNIASVLGLWNTDQDVSVQLVFDPENYGGSWAIDDVYVDPYAPRMTSMPTARARARAIGAVSWMNDRSPA